MEQMEILEFSDRLMAELSGGIRQKVYIAMALAQQAEIIVMDDGFSNRKIKKDLTILLFDVNKFPRESISHPSGISFFSSSFQTIFPTEDLYGIPSSFGNSYCKNQYS